MSKQYLYRVSILNRKNSHPLESICYYSGENQYDMLNSKTYTSNSNDNVIWNGLLVPEKDSGLYKDLPDYLKFRSFKKDIMSNARNILWQNVFTQEKRDDAQFARLFEISIPSFLSQDKAVEILMKLGNVLIEEGMIADCSIHSRNKNINNLSLLDKIKMMDKEDPPEEKKEGSLDYIGFLMCTLRDYKEGRFVNKNRGWNDKKKIIEDWRYKWVEILAETVNSPDISDEAKQSWEEKLNIYSEYKKIKSKNKSFNV